MLDADKIARNALSPDSACFSEVAALFGDRAIKNDGTADRAYIANRVFRDKALLQKLNAIVHPYVIHTLLQQTAESNDPLIVWDVPLLFESGCDAFCACTIAVICNDEIRIQRVMRRDGLTEEQVRTRMANQTTDSFRMASATYTVHNEEDEESFCRMADDLIERIRKELA